MKSCIKCGSKENIRFRMAGNKRRYVCKCGNKGPLGKDTQSARFKWNTANTKTQPIKSEPFNPPAVRRHPYKYVIAGTIVVALIVAYFGG